MVLTAVDPVFVDTNVLVYANIVTAPLHAVAFQTLQDLAGAGVPLWISRQVLREYLATLTRPQTFVAPQPVSVLAAQIGQFQAQMHVAEDNSAVTMHLLALLSTVGSGGKQVHDANIVATMQAHGIAKLLTHNVADFVCFSAVVDVVPLIP